MRERKLIESTPQFIEQCRRHHFKRIAEACKNLYKEDDSICKKCHDVDELCCLWCFCPYYTFPQCGGNWTINEYGFKDCSKCTRYQHPENAARLLEDMFNVYVNHIKAIY